MRPYFSRNGDIFFGVQGVFSKNPDLFCDRMIWPVLYAPVKWIFEVFHINKKFPETIFGATWRTTDMRKIEGG